MEDINIAKASAAREKLLEAIQELTESGEIPWLPRGVGDGKRSLTATRFFTSIHLVTDALGYIAFEFGEPRSTLQFDTSEVADKLSVVIAHQQGVDYISEEGRATQAVYAEELAARRANEQTS